MNILGKIFKQTFWQVLGKIVTSLASFIILGAVARNYKEAGTGTFTLTLTFLSMFFLMNDFGFNAHLLRIAKFQWQKLLGIRILWSVALIILALILLPFLPFATVSFKQAAIYGVLAILGSGIFVTCNLIFQQRLRYDLSVLSSSIGTLVYLLLVLTLTKNHVSLPTLTFAFMMGWIFMGISSLIFVYPFISPGKNLFIKNILPSFDFEFTKKLIKGSWPIAVTLILNVVYFRADSFLIAIFKNQSDVGIYNVSYQIFQSALVLPTFIMNAYYPLMLKSLNGIRLVGLSLLGLAAFGTLLILVIAPYLVNLLTGGGFLGASKSLQILSLGFPAYFLSSLFMYFLLAKGEYKKMLALYTSGCLLNLVLNLIYIPQSSFIAASWITVISEYVILIMQIATLRGILLR